MYFWGNLMPDSLDGWASGRMGDWLLECVDHCEFKKLSETIFDEDENMDKNYQVGNCCYEEMTKKTGGQSMPPVYDEAPLINGYENNRKSFMGSKGFDQSGMKGTK